MRAMGQLAAYAVIAVVVLLVVVYLYRSYARMAGQGLAKHFGLDSGESVAKLWVGQIDVTPSTAESVATAAAGLLAGALLGGIGIATTSVPNVTVVLTDRARLLLLTERPDGTANRVVFAAPGEVAIQRLGPGARRIQGGGSEMLELTPSDGVPLRILLHASAGPELAAWAGRIGAGP
jgi:hypothetical protein